MVKIKKQHLQILSVKEVIEIKKALKHYYRGQQKYLSDFYKVNPVTISDIKRGKRWSHVVID
jgi:predicted membrane protein